MKNYLLIALLAFSFSSFAQSSMRRCTLLPVTDSVGGAIGYKVFEEVEKELKKSNWCTYISNSGLLNVFTRYRESLPQYLKKAEVLATVSEKLKVGSLILVTLKNEINGIEAEINVWGENGSDLYFTEKTLLGNDEIELIAQTVNNWLDMYAKMIPYDAKINGILGDQITLDVGKGYPINVGQKFIVKRPLQKKKHPLLKKIVDWETEILAGGKVFNISDNQALGIVKVNKSDKKIEAGDWVRLEPYQPEAKKSRKKKNDEQAMGTLGVLSVSMFGSYSSVDTQTSGGEKQIWGNIFGLDLKIEGWITRTYFASIEIERSLGTLGAPIGSSSESSVNVNNAIYKILGGYKYLPIGFFYGPQVDFYSGYIRHVFDLDLSVDDGYGRSSLSGLVLGTGANVPISRDFRLFAHAEFIPFPAFTDEDDLYGSVNRATSMELEIGLKYHYTPRMTVDGSFETLSRKAKFDGSFKEISYKDNRLKLGVSFNF
jgi:opacity protein-like surface antigen